MEVKGRKGERAAPVPAAAPGASACCSSGGVLPSSPLGEMSSPG